MSTLIKATADLNLDSWNIDEFNVYSDNIEIEFSFKSIVRPEPYVEFTSIKFGFMLIDSNDKTVQFCSFPRVGEVVENTDQMHLQRVKLEVENGKSYRLRVWAEDAGRFYDYTSDVVVPKKNRPYDSWVWSDSKDDWEAPVPYPTDGKSYLWNNDDKFWHPVPQLYT